LGYIIVTLILSALKSAHMKWQWLSFLLFIRICHDWFQVRSPSSSQENYC